MLCPKGVAQLVGASSCALKGFGFDSWSGFICRLQVPSPVGCVLEGTDGCLSLSSPCSLHTVHLTPIGTFIVKTVYLVFVLVSSTELLKPLEFAK